MAEHLFLTKVDALEARGALPEKIGRILRAFYKSYTLAVQDNGHDVIEYSSLFTTYLDMVVDQIQQPYRFEPYHEALIAPIDYYQFGLDFIRPLVKFEESTLEGQDTLKKIEEALQRKENAILLANHQTEPDPQAISLLLENHHPELAQNMIFVAGHRVVSDPLAIPLSMGRNLLCIFSKKYIETPKEEKSQKLQHNQRTMKKMQQLLSEGGCCIYVAPSGGRDRLGLEGQVDVAPFDPQSIEMFYLMTQQAERLTHFYPLALATYDLLPPPHSIETELGETRHAQCAPIHLAFCPEVDMEDFPGKGLQNKRERREKRAHYLWSLVEGRYRRLIRNFPSKGYP